MDDTIHQEVDLWLQTVLSGNAKIADIGSLDINGSIRDLKQDVVGFDLQKGKNVDVVIESGKIPRDHKGKYDGVVLTSVWRISPSVEDLKKQVLDLLKPNGHLFLSICVDCSLIHSTSEATNHLPQNPWSPREVLEFLEPEMVKVETKMVMFKGHKLWVLWAVKRKRIENEGVVIYTTNFGMYDKPRQQKQLGEYICFGDEKAQAETPWLINRSNLDYPPALSVRFYKTRPNMFFDTAYSIYMDANFELGVPVEEALELLEGRDIAVFSHPDRDCIYSEGKICIDWKRVDEAPMVHQMNTYRAAHYPEANGLYSCGVIIRKHTKEIENLGKMWWAEIKEHTARDQVSFPYCLDVLGIKPTVIEGHIQDNPLFIYKGNHTSLS